MYSSFQQPAPPPSPTQHHYLHHLADGERTSTPNPPYDHGHAHAGHHPHHHHAHSHSHSHSHRSASVVSSTASQPAHHPSSRLLLALQGQAAAPGSGITPSAMTASALADPRAAYSPSAASNGTATIPQPATILPSPAQNGTGTGNGQAQQTGAQGGPGYTAALAAQQTENEKIYYLIADLMNPAKRETALLELSKKREMFDDLALVLWHSFGVMSCLLQEIVSVYPYLVPPTLSPQASNRVCNALALLQCVASHNDTRSLFLSAHIPLFLYPFLNTTLKTRPFEYLRLTSLGVIGALVKQNDNSDVINFLLSTEIIPLCLRIMETGSELSKTVAIFIVQKILLDEMGLNYICQTYERFYAVGTVLSNMVNQLVENQAVRLLKHVVRCYLRLSDNARAREALRACLPEPLRDATFSHVLKGDLVTKRCIASLLLNLSDKVELGS